mmetsp:Transcript_24108/g.49657  ORF Transcript_24108/g.49657 Transcript_24108/m.49657 type:complete len:267 (+) Transcript_24108:213-1013(+)
MLISMLQPSPEPSSALVAAVVTVRIDMVCGVPPATAHLDPFGTRFDSLLFIGGGDCCRCCCCCCSAETTSSDTFTFASVFAFGNGAICAGSPSESVFPSASFRITTPSSSSSSSFPLSSLFFSPGDPLASVVLSCVLPVFLFLLAALLLAPVPVPVLVPVTVLVSALLPPANRIRFNSSSLNLVRARRTSSSRSSFCWSSSFLSRSSSVSRSNGREASLSRSKALARTMLRSFSSASVSRCVSRSCSRFCCSRSRSLSHRWESCCW